MLDDFFNYKSLEPIKEALKENKSLSIDEVSDSSAAFLCAAIQKTLKRPVIVITSERIQTRFCSDLSFFGENLIEFPAWDTLPTEATSPSLDTTGKRYSALKKLREKTSKTLPPILITTPAGLCQKTPSIEALELYSQKLIKGDVYSFEELGKTFLAMGYKKVAVVNDKGQFAVRKGLYDIFDIASAGPCRLEFFDEELESIRSFDPLSQKSIGPLEHLELCPASDHSLILEDTPSNVLDYFDSPPIVIFEDVVAIEDRAVFLKNHKAYVHSPLFSDFSEILDAIEKHPKLFLSKEPMEKLMPKKGPLELFGKTHTSSAIKSPFTSTKRTLFTESDLSLNTLSDVLQETLKVREDPLHLYIAHDNAQEKRTLEEKLASTINHEKLQVHFIEGYLSAGFSMRSSGKCLFSYPELSSHYKLRAKPQRTASHAPTVETFNPSPGDLVVHYHSGVGKYLGVEKKTNHAGEVSEFLAIEYSKNSKLFVPMTQAYLLSPYVGASESRPALDAIGSNRWQTAKIKSQKAIVGYAKKLIELYAARTLGKEYPYTEDSSLFKEFEKSFPYVETEDQLKAIEDVKKEMLSDKCMDLLICGDVGYGKTEVAMRAAFKAVCDGGCQAAVLVPTTVLALQHGETFQERMSGFGVRIEVLSRAKSPKESKLILERAFKGEVDILIGTHRLLSKDVVFKKLGLIVIDEEQRFGVRAKEKLKMAKKRTDCLTLSATPIPRTLHLAMSGAKEMSIIATPPQDRLPIQLVICEFSDEIIERAILRELSRSGQVYFIHNRVDSIFKRKEHLEKLIPDARIGIAHGQMDPERLDDVFHAFKKGDLDVLLATTLIENGIDIPNANTILVERADRHGLSDLYQIKGRVGRSSRSSYAYFLTQPDRPIREEAHKRLQALANAGSYGGGMKVAMRDLEIRGAGDIVGTEQSGQVATIGFHLYCRLLQRAVSALKGQSQGDWIDTKIEFPYKANLSEDYIPSAHLRLELYHRFAEVNHPDEVLSIFLEMEDRFGKAPKSAIWLFHMMRIKAYASKNHWIWIKLEEGRAFAHKQSAKGVKAYAFALEKSDNPEMLAQSVIEHLEKKDSSKTDA